MKFLLKTFSFFVFLISTNAFAYYNIHDTGDILSRGKRNIIGQTQLILDSGTKANVTAAYDWPINDSSQIRSFIGVGDTFHLGVKYKWVPVPDYDTQPAMGAIFGAQFANVDSEVEVSLSASALFSKKYDFKKLGKHNLYVAPTASVVISDGDTKVPLQLIGGTMFKLKKFKNAYLTTELGLEVAKSFSYISVGFIVNFDEFEGLRLKQY